MNEYYDPYYAIGVYSFTAGCILFLWDAISLEKMNFKYLMGSLLFNVGCVFFIIDAHNQS